MRCPTLSELPAPPPERRGWPWTEASPQIADGVACPRVSIVTPSFNQARFLEEAIRSVLLQGYRDLEHVVIDGGSTDGSVDIIRKYEPWLTYWTSERDRGQCDAINKGLRRCTGEYFNYLNSDDAMMPGALGAVACAFASHPSAHIVHGKCLLADESGVASGMHQGRGRDFVEMFENLVAGNSLHPLTVFFRRSAVVRAGAYQEHLHHEMDSDLWFRMIEQGCEIQPMDACVGMFRCYRDQKSASHGRIDELLAVLLGALDRRTDVTDLERRRMKQLAARQCARQKMWAASSSFRDGRYDDYMKCCAGAVAMSPGVLRSWIFWTNLAAPVKRLIPAELHH
jgi:glycosyltransferase involved in cell wall biosynthesis